MDAILGTSLGVFIGITAIFIGFAAWMTGQAIAGTWRPYWQLVLYSFLLGFAARFLIYGLYDGELWHLSGYLLNVATLLIIGTVAYLLTRARKMVGQYPWLYERAGIFSWKARH